jgi:hypothetical protein
VALDHRECGRTTTWSQFRSTRRQRGWWLDGVRRDRRVRAHRSARGKMRGVVPDPRCGVAKFAADGPGRLPTSVSRACWKGHRQVARRGPPRATTGWPDRQDEAPQAELLANSGSEPGATRVRTSSNRPLEQPGKITGLSQGWAGQSPPQSRARPLTSDRTPAADVDAPRSFTRWANRNSSVRFTSLAPLRRRAASGSSAHRTRPWPRRHSLQGWSAVFLKPQFRAQHERSGFPAANDQNRTTSGPRLLMSHWPSSKGAQCRS